MHQTLVVMTQTVQGYMYVIIRNGDLYTKSEMFLTFNEAFDASLKDCEPFNKEGSQMVETHLPDRDLRKDY